MTNLDTRLLDWNDAVLGNNLEQHDIVIASRSIGMHDVEKISSFAKKFAVVIAWANAPNIPTVLGDLFKDVENTRKYPPMNIDRRIGYNVTYNMIYDMGYDPNIRIVLDGFTRDFTSNEIAYQELWLLQQSEEEAIPPVFRKNVDRWLSPNSSDGVTFRRETKSFVIWWNPKQVPEHQENNR